MTKEPRAIPRQRDFWVGFVWTSGSASGAKHPWYLCR